MRRLGYALFGFAFLILVLLTPLGDAQTSTWRPAVLGKRHMVASGHYATAMAAYRVLEQGGNALHAGISATFASTVVEPSRPASPAT